MPIFLSAELVLRCRIVVTSLFMPWWRFTQRPVDADDARTLSQSKALTDVA